MDDIVARHFVGVGFYTLATSGTIVTLAVLAAVAASERLLPQRRYALVTVRYRRSAIIASSAFRARLREAGFKPSAISPRLEEDSVAYTSTVSDARDETVEAFSTAMLRDMNVVGFDYLPHDS